MIIFGLVLEGEVAHLVVVDELGVLADAVGHGSNHLPEKLTLAPWVRCPPCGRLIASTLSPGWQNAA